MMACLVMVSPPRLWRTAVWAGLAVPFIGFTSAPAENRDAPLSTNRPSRFHLRACGEQATTLTVPSWAIVSPPRLRRTGNSCPLRVIPEGFTSAPAENSERER